MIYDNQVSRIIVSACDISALAPLVHEIKVPKY